MTLTLISLFCESSDIREIIACAGLGICLAEFNGELVQREFLNSLLPEFERLDVVILQQLVQSFWTDTKSFCS